MGDNVDVRHDYIQGRNVQELLQSFTLRSLLVKLGFFATECDSSPDHDTCHKDVIETGKEVMGDNHYSESLLVPSNEVIGRDQDISHDYIHPVTLNHFACIVERFTLLLGTGLVDIHDCVRAHNNGNDSDEIYRQYPL